MARPKGEQIEIICGVCGTVRAWPKSKAAGKKYCSVECRDRGREIVTDWHWIASGASVFRMPAGNDPNGRGIIDGDRLFLRTESGWQELIVQKCLHTAGWAITERRSIDVTEIPSNGHATPHATTEGT